VHVQVAAAFVEHAHDIPPFALLSPGHTGTATEVSGVSAALTHPPVCCPRRGATTAGSGRNNGRCGATPRATS
jgi:hypothetical protein